MTARPSFYIKTFGCQMNQADSDDLAMMFLHRGFVPAPDAASATLVHVNTCAVRDKAERKFYSFMGGMKQRKGRGEAFVVGVGGCIAELTDLEKKLSFLDYRIGAGDPKEYERRLNEALDRGLKGAGPPEGPAEPYRDETAHLQSMVPGMTDVSQFYNVVRGCSVNCTFCVVPNVRGPERSKPPDVVAREVRGLVEERGAREVVLLGQNILAYGLDLEPRRRLLDAFQEIHGIEGLKRIRFVTSHPSFVVASFLEGMAELPKICRHFHIPFQSGDDDILKRMNRGYTIDLYRRKIELIRSHFPDASVTSDLIVGFPGETDGQFRKTLRILEELEIDQCYSFAYSPRPDTAAFAWEDDVPAEVKKERLNELIAAQTRVALKANERLVGTRQTVLIENRASETEPAVRGRTETNKIVECRLDSGRIGSPGMQPGELLAVVVERATPYGLQAGPVSV